MKKYKLIIYIFVIISLFISSSFVAFADETSDDEIVRTIQYMNEIRSHYNLPELQYNVNLNRTASLHNRYMATNKTFSSIEESGDLYYRGRYPWDRASYNKYDKDYVFELIMKDALTYANGISLLMQNPYARYAILDPLYVDVGMNTYEDNTTYLIGGATRDKGKIIIYPYDGQQNVSPIFNNQYILNPYDMLDESYESTGVPISVTVYTGIGTIKSFEEVDIQLINLTTGDDVEFEVINSKKDKNISNTLMILPLESYNLGTTYSLIIEGDVYFDHLINLEDGSSSNRISIDYKGTFTTKHLSIENDLYPYITRAEFVEKLVKQAKYDIVESLEPIFSDVDVNQPLFKYINTAYQNNLVEGYGNGIFRPDVNISREQAYTVIMRSYEQQVGPIVLDSDRVLPEFIDYDSISDYAKVPVQKAIQIGILSDSPVSFNPNTYISENEFEQILISYINSIK